MFQIDEILTFCHLHQNIYQVDKTIGGETLEIEFHVKSLKEMLKIIEEFEKNLQNFFESNVHEDFFSVEVAPSPRGEFETPDVWMKLIKDFGRKIKIVEAEFWLPINDKEQLMEAEKVLGTSDG
mgnify:CR=1 FL=1